MSAISILIRLWYLRANQVIHLLLKLLQSLEFLEVPVTSQDSTCAVVSISYGNTLELTLMQLSNLRLDLRELTVAPIIPGKPAGPFEN